MKFKEPGPMLWLPTLEGYIEFYANILGLICNERNSDWGWASVQKRRVEIMLATPNEYMDFDKPVFTVSFYIDTDKYRHIASIVKTGIQNISLQWCKFGTFNY